MKNNIDKCFCFLLCFADENENQVRDMAILQQGKFDNIKLQIFRISFTIL